MHLFKRKIKGHIYYYAVIKARVNGKPRNIWQYYLGTAEDIFNACAGKPSRRDKKERWSLYWEFGSVCALLSMVRRIRLVEIINSHIPLHEKNITTGNYIALAAINRCLAPCSKARLAEWYQRTSLLRILKFKPSLLSSQRFWDHMDLLTKERIEEIENELTQHLIKEFNLDLRCLIYDSTNFFTFIDTFTECELPQRGRNKQGRNSLRQVNLGLVVTKEFHIPLFHYVYGGNINDVTEFGTVTETLAQRYKMLSKNCNNITIVYDKGNNSKDNQKALDNSGYHFIGSLVLANFKKLLKIPLKRFREVTELPMDKTISKKIEGLKVYRTKAKVFKKTRTIVITYNDNLFETQLKTILNQIKKAKIKLFEINKKKKTSKLQKQKQIDKVLSKKHLRDIIKIKWNKRTFSYELNRKNFHKLQRTFLGKTILFTDQDNWTDEEIIAGYRGQYQIEKAFKQMKDPYFVCWYPQFHWTDQKIRVHAFYCVLALTLSSLLNRELRLKGINVTIREMFNQLRELKETLIIKLPKKKKFIDSKDNIRLLRKNESELIPSAPNETQRNIIDVLNLNQFLPV